MRRAMRRDSRAHRALLLAGLCLALPAAACKKGGGPLAKAELNDEAFAHVPVPPADGPKLLALGAVTVLERPALSAPRLGELRAGSAVARSKDPYSKKDCEGGWYAVRPRGFVCAGAMATVDPSAGARGVPAPPDPGRALPYRYARARTENVPIYARAPSPAEQLANEPDLKRVASQKDQDPLGAAANDVPLDGRGVPTGPPVLVAGGDGIEGGRRTAQSYFTFGSDASAPAFLPAPSEVKAGALRKGSVLAVTGSLELESISGLRRFAMTTSGQLVPTDRLKPALGSTWHGVDLEKIGLPVAFVHKLGVHTFSLAKGKAVKHDDEVERRAAVPLTGKFRTVEGVRYEETREGNWMRSLDLVVIVRRHKLPDVAKGSQRWIDVSIANQTLTAYEGTKPIYATLVSTGRDQLRDPATTASTPRGIFRVTGQSLARAVDARDAGGGFDVADAPWVLDLEATGAETSAVKTFSMFGAYWADLAGEATTFHDIALAPIDAHRLWTWAGAELPDGWQGAYGQDEGALVFVRP
jgi:hypothetical protein